MKVIETEIAGVKIIEPDVFGDARGWFCETYNAERYRKAGIENVFVQDNESFSSYVPSSATDSCLLMKSNNVATFGESQSQRFGSNKPFIIPP